MTESGANTPPTWTHASVLAFAGGEDPIAAVVARARAVVASALDDGWSGPPFDPIQLADILGLAVLPSDEVRDARTVAVASGNLRIEFNPNRPRGRMRYSLAHEIAHTLFDDCADRVRNRAAHTEMEGDDWQLEALCNVAAAEFLMPAGAATELGQHAASIDHLLVEQRRFDVSTEALLIRAMRVTDDQCAMFCASRVESGKSIGRYRIDYKIGSSTWGTGLGVGRGHLLPEKSVIADCAAIGFTAKGDEVWGDSDSELHVECVGIPPYPGSRFPRIVGVVRPVHPSESAISERAITYVKGDATSPRGEGPRVVVQVVNDATPNWGGRGFAMAVKQAFPDVQAAFQEWASSRHALTLGAVHFAPVDAATWVASIVAQHGYGPSTKPRVRYAALCQGLEEVAAFAAERHASLHMPRVGCGQAGGNWPVVEDFIRRTVALTAGRVTIYDPPGSREAQGIATSQQTLSF